MTNTGYSERVMDHFRNPRNVGVIDGADGVGERFNPVCGDTTRLSLRIRPSTGSGLAIVEARFQTNGCPTAIATSSIATELLAGMPLDRAAALTKEDVAKAAGGLPPNRMHCSVLVVDALRAALEDYAARSRPSTSSGPGA